MTTLGWEAMQQGWNAPTLAELLRRPAWMADAGCRGREDVNFFPGRGESHGPARAVCAGCPVEDECGAYAKTFGYWLDGVWAGTSAKGRRSAIAA